MINIILSYPIYQICLPSFERKRGRFGVLTRQEDVTYLEKKPAKGRPNGTRCGVPFRSATHGPEGSRLDGTRCGMPFRAVKITEGWIRASDRNTKIA